MLELAKHTPHYLKLVRLIVKHGGGEFAASIGLVDRLKAESGGAAPLPTPEALARDIEQLGTAYIKLAQIASTREDLITREYVEAFQRLQDDVEPIELGEVESIIKEELGTTPQTLFRSFESTPLACGSLGQVHDAVMRDGRRVCVKVQRPGVETEARNQLAALREIAALADANSMIGRKFRFCSLVDAVEYALSSELDFRLEAAHLQQLAENLASFTLLEIPSPITDLATRRLLIMEKLSGQSLKDVSGVVLNELPRQELGRQMVKAFLKQILIDGLFHADPHPGNLLLTHDHKLGLIDGGMVVSVSPKLRRQLAELLMAISQHEGEEAARIAVEIGYPEDDFAADRFRAALARVVAGPSELPVSPHSPGRIAIRLLNVAGEHGLVLPFELILFSKSLLQIENTVYRLCPQLNLQDAVRDYSARLLLDRASDAGSLSKAARTALDSVELAAELPRRLNRITELVSENRLRVSVDVIDEQEFLAGVHKIANRITAGLVTSALIIGASILMRVDAGPTLFGFPLLATALFLLAAVVGLYLVWLALVRDA